MDSAQRFRARHQGSGSEVTGAKRNRRRIAAVGFDFDHTLGIDNKLERVAFLRLLDAACERGGRCIGTLAEEIECIDAVLADQRAGAFTIEEAVERFMARHGNSEGSWPEHYKRMCVDMVDSFVIPQPDAREMLHGLRELGVRSAILTNGWSPLQQRKALRAGFEGRVVVSSDIGVQKPAAQAFAALAHALQAPLERIAYVGDTPASDIAGSLNAGMNAVWLDAEGTTYPDDLPRPTAVIHSLAELLSLV